MGIQRIKKTNFSNCHEQFLKKKKKKKKLKIKMSETFSNRNSKKRDKNKSLCKDKVVK